MNNPAPISAPLGAPAAEDSEFVRFWNDVLAPKFARFKHILVGGLSRHSDAVFPTLPVRSGDQSRWTSVAALATPRSAWPARWARPAWLSASIAAMPSRPTRPGRK